MRKWIVSFMLAGAVVICLGGCKDETAAPTIPETPDVPAVPAPPEAPN